jgi:hypothetical protein
MGGVPAQAVVWAEVERENGSCRSLALSRRCQSLNAVAGFRIRHGFARFRAKLMQTFDPRMKVLKIDLRLP